MKKTIIIGSVLVMALGLLTPQAMQAQGIVYLSNLGQTSTDSRPVGSDSWLAESFLTGPNAGGYLLDSIQLAKTNATGNPSSFTLLLYSSSLSNEYYPNNSLGVLNGSANPETSNVFTYTTASGLTLACSTTYFLVVTAGTTVADGAYEWNLASENYTRSGGWFAPSGAGSIDIYQSIDGLNWVHTLINPQFAITATPIPEPGVLSLFALGGLGFLWQRRRF